MNDHITVKCTYCEEQYDNLRDYLNNDNCEEGDPVAV